MAFCSHRFHCPHASTRWFFTLFCCNVPSSSRFCAFYAFCAIATCLRLRLFGHYLPRGISVLLSPSRTPPHTYRTVYAFHALFRARIYFILPLLFFPFNAAAHCIARTFTAYIAYALPRTPYLVGLLRSLHTGFHLLFLPHARDSAFAACTQVRALLYTPTCTCTLHTAAAIFSTFIPLRARHPLFTPDATLPLPTHSVAIPLCCCGPFLPFCASFALILPFALHTPSPSLYSPFTHTTTHTPLAHTLLPKTFYSPFPFLPLPATPCWPSPCLSPFPTPHLPPTSLCGTFLCKNLNWRLGKYSV